MLVQRFRNLLGGLVWWRTTCLLCLRPQRSQRNGEILGYARTRLLQWKKNWLFCQHGFFKSLVKHHGNLNLFRCMIPRRSDECHLGDVDSQSGTWVLRLGLLNPRRFSEEMLVLVVSSSPPQTKIIFLHHRPSKHRKGKSWFFQKKWGPVSGLNFFQWIE